MSRYIKRTLITIFLAGIAAVSSPAWAGEESLYEYYTGASQDTLKSETRDMGKQLATVFGQGSINAKQRKIDFSEYFVNLRNLALYGSKLATYSEYEKDLGFARDKEIFKGLPDKSPDSDAVMSGSDRKDFVQTKYERMTKNVEEEIETYVSGIHLSLDACETIAQNDLSGILEDQNSAARIKEYMKGKEYQDFLSKKDRLASSWADLNKRISAQFALWQPKAESPDDPLIDPKITGAI